MKDRTWELIRADKPDQLLPLLRDGFDLSVVATPLRLGRMPVCCLERVRRRQRRDLRASGPARRAPELEELAARGVLYPIKCVLGRSSEACDPDDLGRALVASCASDHWAVGHLLIHAGADPDWGGGAALRSAIRAGHSRMVRLLLNREADISLVPDIMELASVLFRPEIVCMLLVRGADKSGLRDVDAPEPPRRGPGRWRQTALVCLLLSMGVRLPKRAGLALVASMARGYSAATAFLLAQHDTDVRVCDDYPIRFAARTHAPGPVVRALLSRGADPRKVELTRDLEWLLDRTEPYTTAHAEIIAELLVREMTGRR